MLPKNVVHIDEYRRKRGQAKMGTPLVVASSPTSLGTSEARLKRIYEKIAKIQTLMLEIRKSTFLKK